MQVNQGLTIGPFATMQFLVNFYVFYEMMMIMMSTCLCYWA